MEIIPNPILAALLVLPFFVTFGLLHVILFKPLMAYLAERDHTISHARHEAAEIQHQVETRTTELQARLVEARESIGQQRNAARKRALAAEQAILSESRAEADVRIKAAIHQLGTDQKVARITLQESSKLLSREIAARVLGRELQA